MNRIWRMQKPVPKFSASLSLSVQVIRFPWLDSHTMPSTHTFLSSSEPASELPSVISWKRPSPILRSATLLKLLLLLSLRSPLLPSAEVASLPVNRSSKMNLLHSRFILYIIGGLRYRLTLFDKLFYRNLLKHS